MIEERKEKSREYMERNRGQRGLGWGKGLEDGHDPEDPVWELFPDEDLLD